MIWVRSEYAETLAVAFAWLSALLPWNLTYATGIAGGSLLFVRFPFFQIRFAFGVPAARPVLVLDPLSAVVFQAGQTIADAYRVWALGAAILSIALLLSVLVYVDVEPTGGWPVDAVKAIGAVLGVTAVVLSAATYLLSTGGFPGLPIPIGVVLLYTFAGVLLVVERRE